MVEMVEVDGRGVLEDGVVVMSETIAAELYVVTRSGVMVNNLRASLFLALCALESCLIRFHKNRLGELRGSPF